MNAQLFDTSLVVVFMAGPVVALVLITLVVDVHTRLTGWLRGRR